MEGGLQSVVLTANGGDIGAAAREARHECLLVGIGVEGAVATGLNALDTGVTTAKEDGDTAGSQLREACADRLGVRWRHGVLVVGVAVGDDLPGDFGLGEDVVQPHHVSA